MKKMNLIVVLVLCMITNRAWSTCNCGYGGLCLGGNPGRNADPCSCDIVSKGIFESAPNNCNKMVSNFCDSITCADGVRCRNAFGTYICDCVTRLKTGQTCDFDFVDDRTQAQSVYLWFPVTLQKQWIVTIGADSLPATTKFTFEYENGRTLWLTKSMCQQTDMVGVMERCYDRGGEPPDCWILQDIINHHPIYLYNCLIPLPISSEREVRIKGLVGPVGYYHDVKVLIMDANVQLNATYRVFIESGELNRKCPYKIQLTGCGMTPETAPEVKASSKLSLSAAVLFNDANHSDCLVRKKVYNWYLTSFKASYYPTSVADGQDIIVIPSKLGFVHGIAVAVVYLTFEDLIGAEDESVLAECYIKLIETELVVLVEGADVNYICDIETQVNLTATVVESDWPSEDHQFQWICSRELCPMNTNLNRKHLNFIANVPCGKAHGISLFVHHPWSTKNFSFQGLLRFHQHYKYRIFIKCEPNCNNVNPGYPLTLKASEEPYFGNDFEWDLSPLPKSTLECDTLIPKDVYIIEPFTLNSSSTYRFEVRTRQGFKTFAVKTAPTLQSMQCEMLPTSGRLFLDKFNLSCFPPSNTSLLSYWVYEGTDSNLLTVSKSSKIEGIRISVTPVWVDIVDSSGCTSSVNVSVDARRANETDMNDFLNQIPVRISQLQMLLREKNYNEMANEIYIIMKLSHYGVSMPWKYRLIDYLFEIQICQRVECIIKTSNSIRHLTMTHDSQFGSVDEFILKSGGLLDRLVQNLKIIPSESPLSETFNMVPALHSIHDAIFRVMNFEDPILFHPTVDEDVRRKHYRKVEKGAIFARRALRELGLYMTSHMPNPTMPLVLVSDGNKEKTVIVSNNLAYFNCFVSLTKPKSYFKFTPEAMEKSNIGNPALAVAMVNFNKERLWWEESSTSRFGEMLEVYIYEKKDKRSKWTQIKTPMGPIQTYMLAEVVTQNITGVSEYPGDVKQQLTEKQLDSYVKVHRVLVPRAQGTVYLHFPQNLVQFIHVSIHLAYQPNFKLLETTPLLQQSVVAYNFNSNETRSYVYIGILPKQENEPIAVEYKFEMGLIKCVARSEDLWKSVSCGLTGILNATVVCYCDHLSLLNVEISVPNNNLMLPVDIVLETPDYYSYYSLFSLVEVLIVFLFVFGMSYGLDNIDRSKKTVVFLDDNHTRETYKYLVAVFTGAGFLSGTSSHVAIRLIGEKSASRPHILTPAKAESTLGWDQDSWFILTTTQYLGRLVEIEIWLDSKGHNQDWFCKEFIIWDIQNGDRFTIPVHTRLSFYNLYRNRDSSFFFKTGRRRRRRAWERYTSHFLAYTRQDHYWISIFFLHPRCIYNRLHRSVLVSVLVLVSAAASMLFCSANVGPVDDPALQFTRYDLGVAIVTALISTLVTSVPTQMLRFGQNSLIKSLSLENEDVTKGHRKLSWFVHPVTYLPITTAETYRKNTRKWYRCTLTAYAVSGAIMAICLAIVVKWGLRFNLNKYLNWLLVFIFSIGIEALIINPIQVFFTAALVTYVVPTTAREIVVIDVDSLENTPPAEESSARMKDMMLRRIKPMYKPPYRREIRKKALKQKRREECFDPIRFVMVAILITLTSLIIGKMEIRENYHKNVQISDHFIRSRGKHGTTVDDLDSVRNRTKYFDYLRGTVLPSLHRTNWYNGKPLAREGSERLTPFNTSRPTTKFRGYCADYTTKLMGAPQLRQQRISRDSREIVAEPFRKRFTSKYGHLSVINEDTKTYLPQWETPNMGETYLRPYWSHWSELETMTGPLLGPSQFSYSGSGYVEFLHWSLGLSQESLVDLELDQWLDNSTRVIFLIFNMYNVYLDKVSSVTIITESLPSGVYRSLSFMDTATVSYENLPKEQTIAVYVLFLFLVLTAHSVRTLTIISKRGFKQYSTTIGGTLDLSTIITGYLAVATTINQFLQLSWAYREVEDAAKDEYTPLYYRFFQKDISNLFIGFFMVCISTFRTVLFRNLVGFEAVQTALARTRILVVIFIGLSIITFYDSVTVYYFGSMEIINLFYLLFFKEAGAIEVITVSTSSSFTVILAVSLIVVFLITARVNIAVLVMFHAQAGRLRQKRLLISPLMWESRVHHRKVHREVRLEYGEHFRRKKGNPWWWFKRTNEANRKKLQRAGTPYQFDPDAARTASSTVVHEPDKRHHNHTEHPSQRSDSSLINPPPRAPSWNRTSSNSFLN